jgi:hypothetical protein
MACHTGARAEPIHPRHDLHRIRAQQNALKGQVSATASNRGRLIAKLGSL